MLSIYNLTNGKLFGCVICKWPICIKLAPCVCGSAWETSSFPFNLWGLFILLGWESLVQFLSKIMMLLTTMSQPIFSLISHTHTHMNLIKGSLKEEILKTKREFITFTSFRFWHSPFFLLLLSSSLQLLCVSVFTTQTSKYCGNKLFSSSALISVDVINRNIKQGTKMYFNANRAVCINIRQLQFLMSIYCNAVLIITFLIAVIIVLVVVIAELSINARPFHRIALLCIILGN